MMLVNVIVTKAYHGMSSYDLCKGRCKDEASWCNATHIFTDFKFGSGLYSKSKQSKRGETPLLRATRPAVFQQCVANDCNVHYCPHTLVPMLFWQTLHTPSTKIHRHCVSGWPAIAACRLASSLGLSCPKRPLITCARVAVSKALGQTSVHTICTGKAGTVYFPDLPQMLPFASSLRLMTHRGP